MWREGVILLAFQLSSIFSLMTFTISGTSVPGDTMVARIESLGELKIRIGDPVA